MIMMSIMMMLTLFFNLDNGPNNSMICFELIFEDR